MRRTRNKNQLLIIVLAVGFFIGIVYENIVSKGGNGSVSIFSKDYLKGYVEFNIATEKYLWHVVKTRFVLLAILFLLSYFKWKKLFVLISVWLCGFFAGVMTVGAILQLGMKGILFCLVALLPHGVFYIMAYTILFVYWYRYPEIRWNRAKISFVMLMFVVGITTEVYLNPMFVKWMIRGL